MTSVEPDPTEVKNRNVVVYVVVAVMLVTLTGGFILKAQCLKPWDGRQYAQLCYNDIQPLYVERGVAQGAFPYVSDTGISSAGGIEYPVLTGLFMWAMGLFVTADVDAYLIVTAVGLAPFGIYVAFQLARMVRWRALMWAAAPAIVLYAFHNWDLLVVAAVVAGIAFWRSDRPLAAAILFGIGGALKMYPMIFLAPLFLWVWQRAGWKGGLKEALKIAVGGIGAWLVINLPFMLINFDGWYATYEFHRLRPPNYDTIWALKFQFLDIARLNMVTFGLTGVSFVAILVAGLWKGRRDGEYPFLQVCASLLAAFLLWNKVHSPQYTLWLLPFFALLKISAVWWLAYSATDLLVYIGVFRFFYAIQYFRTTPEHAFRAMSIGVQARAALLAVLIFVFFFSRPAGDTEEEPAEEIVSHPPPTVTPVGEQAPA